MNTRRHLSNAGFTLTEVIIASFLSTILVAAVASLTMAALKTYYVESDYLEIGGQNRRLVNALTEQGTLADDLVIFYDIGDLTAAPRGDRGDCLVLFNRSTASPVSRSPAWGFITNFQCYYLARTSGTTGPVSLWHFTGTVVTGSETVSPVTAINTYTRTAAKRVSGDIFNATFPRVTPALTTPLTPRAGIFTNDGVGTAGAPPSALVNLPARLPARAGNPHKATSNLTFSITPRN